MIKTTLSIIGLSLVSTLALAADPLHGTKWKTIDDVTKKPLSVVQFTETSKGVLSAKIVDVLEGTEGEKCTKCKGKFFNKPLQGVQIVSGLKKAGNNSYDGGKITDPKNGKTYKCTITKDGADALNVRGYIGFSFIGRSQTWYRLK